MPDIEYKLFFDNKPATSMQLGRIEDIQLEQEVDMAWEARLEVPVCLDERGTWTEEHKSFLTSFSRIRVEVKAGKTPFRPLIDGPVIGFDDRKSSEPGQSSITILVQDDSVYLNREESIARFEDLLDHEIASQIFSDFSQQVASTDIETTPASTSALPSVVMQRGTAMQLLRSLARRQGFHAYVLPGNSPGESIGCFKAFSKMTDGLPQLLLLGSNRNIKTFDVKFNAQSPSVATASTLHITDKGIVSSSTSFRDRELLGEETTLEEGKEPTVRILPPHQGESVDLDQAVAAEADKSGYAFEASGSVMEGCYLDVLQPYRLVTVMAGDTPLSGDYVIYRVTHKLTRSQYSQSFALKRNARSAGSNGSQLNQGKGIF